MGGTIVPQVHQYGQCRRAGARKGSLRLVLMSATIELEPFVRYFESAAHVVRCGRIARAPARHLGTRSTRSTRRCICAWGTAYARVRPAAGGSAGRESDGTGRPRRIVGPRDGSEGCERLTPRSGRPRASRGCPIGRDSVGSAAHGADRRPTDRAGRCCDIEGRTNFPIDELWAEDVLDMLPGQCPILPRHTTHTSTHLRDPRACACAGVDAAGMPPTGPTAAEARNEWATNVAVVGERLSELRRQQRQPPPSHATVSRLQALLRRPVAAADYRLIGALVAHIAAHEPEGAILIFLPG